MKLDIYQKVTDQIIAALEGGTIPWLMPWMKLGRPINFSTKKQYRGINVWLLMAAKRSTPYWVTFNQAKKLGGNVKSGEKAQMVVYWNWLIKKDEGADKAKRIPFLKYYNVFNLDQTEGIEIPKIGAALEFTPIEKCEAIVNGYRNAPKIAEGEDRAYYSPALDSINMPPRSSFKTVADWYATLFHELTHSTGHATRLNREGIIAHNGFGSESYSKEELIAEFGSAFLAADAGIDVAVRSNEVAYIQNWLKALKNDKKLAVTAAGKAQKAVDHILGIQNVEENSEALTQ